MSAILLPQTLLLLVFVVQLVGLSTIFTHFVLAEEKNKSFLLFIGLVFTTPIYILGLVMVVPILFVDYETLVQALSVIWQGFESVRPA